MPPALSNSSPDDLWAAAVGCLDEDLRATIDFNHEKIETVSEVLKFTDKAQKECAAKSWRLRRKNGATVSVRDVLSKVVKWVNHFKEIGDIVVQYDPAHAALPWAGVRFLLQIVVEDFRAYNFVLESIENLAELLCHHACVEELLLQFSKAPKNGSSASNPTQELRQALVQLYVRVLIYLAHARAYFQQSTAKRFVKSALLQPSDLEESFAVIAAAQSKVDRCLHLASIRDELDHHDRLKDLVSALQAPLSRWSDELTKITDQLDKTKRREILQWLSKEPYRKHHQLVREGVVEGTGQWLLSDPIYLRWKEESASSILWLHGVPGSGKSKLVSLVVEDAVAAFHNHQSPPPAYFYCSRNPAEPTRADPETILASVARQLSCLKPGCALLQPTIVAYDAHEEEGFAAESLRLHETCTLIMRLSENYPMLTIILDALDECNPAIRESLLFAMELILKEAPCLVKIFVSSRDDQDIVFKLRQYPNLELSSHRNSNDIAKFVELETYRLMNSGKLLRYSSAQQELKEDIIRRVASDAQGMFRWASLQLEALCELKSDKAVLERLGRLPQTLEELYKEIFQKIENYPSASDRQYAKHTLSWLLCAQRKLSSAEFLTAVSMAVPHQQLQSSQILDFCCNLVVLDTQLDTFRFAHLSVREFLEKQAGYASSFSNGLAAETCLVTMFGLATDRFSVSVLSKLGYHGGIDKTQLKKYSYAFWAPHCQAAAERRKQGQLRELLQEFTQPEMTVGSAISKWNDYLKGVPREIEYDLRRKLRACCAAAKSWAFIACAFNIYELLEGGTGFAIDGLQNEDNETCAQVAAKAGSCEALSKLLSSDNVRITEAVAKAAAHNWENGKEVIGLLLDQRGDQVTITEDVVKAAASNWGNGKEVMGLLLDRCGDQVTITGDVVKAAARNWDNGKEVMGLLLDRRGDQVTITEDVVKAAAHNRRNGKEVMGLLLDRRGDQVTITEDVVKAAARNWDNGKEIMGLLFDRCGDQVMITEDVVSLIARKFDDTIMGLLLDRCGDQVTITEDVVKAAASNWRKGKEIMGLLLDRRGDQVTITEDVVKAAAHNRRNGKEVMGLLLDRRRD
ncbi:uncharacterized protein FTOL_03646 [Fusarium torulosum]|uniref:NWD NACHT-NTPase N-terminal domain-containing protein n=1 Tax=Fusarium torulosum TaxID=33205 RepID=A0AAE8M3Y3_9HYPO|nr:uncharacterized protein FTOL_03646 [Fusarium torulosum]